MLMRNGFPIAIIQKNDRQKYYEALDKADTGDLAAVVKMVAQAAERSLNITLKAVEKSSVQTEFLILSELAEKTEFSAKHLNLLSRKGLLKSQKEGRKWYSSLAAVDEYRKSRLRNRD